jgi:hypothetical protein
MDESDSAGGWLDAPRVIDIDSLTRAAFKSFSLIEPWYLAEKRCEMLMPVALYFAVVSDGRLVTYYYRFRHPLVSAMVDKITRLADVYFSAVKESVNSVNDGWTVASDAISLCDYLSSSKHTLRELESFRMSMLETTSAALRRTQSTVESFRKVRQGLLQVRIL